MKRRTRQKLLAKLRRRQKVRRRAKAVERVVAAINAEGGLPWMFASGRALDAIAIDYGIARRPGASDADLRALLTGYRRYIGFS